MKVMLDTNICIYIIKQKPESVLVRLSGFSVGDLGISVITMAELEYGATKSSQPARNHEALEQFVSPLQIALFDRQAAIAYGRIRTFLERKGRLIGSMDLLIAAHAVGLDVRLATNNIKEFRRVPGLSVENWL